LSRLDQSPADIARRARGVVKELKAKSSQAAKHRHQHLVEGIDAKETIVVAIALRVVEEQRGKSTDIA
jgi:hypothetical protein